MRIASGVTDQYIYFVAVDATNFTSRETALSTFTVYRSRNGAAAALMTHTINETDATNMPGVYELLLNDDMTIDAGDDTQEMAFHITHAGMAPVTRTIELYRPKITAGNTLGVASTGDISGNIDGNVDGTVAGVTPAAAGAAMTLAAGAVTNASLAGNMEIVFETDFATNYNATRNAWATNLTDTIGTLVGGEIAVGAFAASSITAAAVAASALDGKGDWNVGKTGYSLTVAPLNAAGIRSAVGLASANMDTQFTASATATGFATPTNITAGTITTTTNLTNLPTIPANWLTAAGTAADFTTEIQSGLATAASISALNNVAATDIVSAGAITTSAGAVSNVTLVATTTTNTDMRGTDNAATAADVNAQVKDVIDTDTYAELTDVPAASVPLSTKIGWLYMLARNKVEQTSSVQTLRADDKTTSIGTASVTDNGTTFTRDEWTDTP